MKKLYLVNTLGTREFWTVEMLPEGAPEHFYERTADNTADEPVIAVLRSLYSNESVDAENCDDVEDDSSWDEVALTEDEYAHLFDRVKIIDERDF